MESCNIILITGQDPSRGKGGGSSYIRSHAKVAKYLGHKVYILCMSYKDEIKEEKYASIHKIECARIFRRTSNSFFLEGQTSFLKSWLQSLVFSPYMVRFHKLRIVKRLEGLTSKLDGPIVIHGFYTWGTVGLSFRARTQMPSERFKIISSLYTIGRREIYIKVKESFKALRIDIFCVSLTELMIYFLFARTEERKLCRSKELILYNYDSVKNIIVREYGHPYNLKKIGFCEENCISDNCPSRKVSAIKNKHKAIHIISISRHDPRKGIVYLIKALKTLKDNDINFIATIGSGGPLFSYHKKLIKRYGLVSKVVLTGWQNKVDNLLSSGDIFVLPSIEEGSSSISMLEAMRYGLAIIATEVDGIKEDIINGQNGILIKPKDHKQLALKLKFLIMNEPIIQSLGKAAQSSVNLKYSSKIYKEDFSDIYNFRSNV